MRQLNSAVLLIFAPVLILTGVLGFVIPPRQSVLSGAPAYNVFHIVSGVVGLLLVLTKRESLARGFNAGFGVIDLYQALASGLHLFPEDVFRWTWADDVLHLVIGTGLVVVGAYRARRPGT